LEIIKSILDFVLHIDKHLAAITSTYQNYTYLILFLIIFAETGFVVTPFLPGDSLLFAAGALIAGGQSGLNIFVLALILIVAAIGGNSLNYEFGKLLGVKVFKPENKILKLEYYTKTKDFFDRHGGNAVILSRFVPIIRTVAPFVAGVGRMPFLRYTLYNAIGGIAWIVLLLSAGYFLGNFDFFKKHFSLVTIAIVLISILPPIVAALKNRGSKTAV
jgi:membrane-associated protein